MSEAEDPKAIYQAVLDTFDGYIEAGDFDAFAARILLPQTIQTHETVQHVETHAQLRAAFDDVRERLTLRNVARRSRHCTSARFVGTDEIEGSHTTWLVTDGETIVESYKVSNQLRRIDGTWYVSGNTYAGAPDTLPVHMANAIANTRRGA